MALHLIFYGDVFSDFADLCAEHYCILKRANDKKSLYSLLGNDNIDAVILPLHHHHYHNIKIIADNIEQRADIFTAPIILLVDDITQYDSQEISHLPIDDILYYQYDFADNIKRLHHITKYHYRRHSYISDDKIITKMMRDHHKGKNIYAQQNILLFSDDSNIIDYVGDIARTYNMSVNEDGQPTLIIGDAHDTHIYQKIYDAQQQYPQKNMMTIMILQDNTPPNDIIINNLNIDHVIARNEYIYILKAYILFFIRYHYYGEMIKKFYKNHYDNSLRDPLTNLYNRRYLSQYFQQLNHDEPYIVMMIDIDNFKQVNEEKGHLAGDEILKSLARFLLLNLRAQDFICRYGGDEFIIICSKTEAYIAEILCQRLQEQSMIHISIGYICGDGDMPYDHDIILKMTDNALRDAKSLGKNRAIAYKRDNVI